MPLDNTETDTFGEEVAALVQRELIEQAAAHHAALVAKLDEARASGEQAQAAHDAAWRDYTTALDGVASRGEQVADPLALENAVRESHHKRTFSENLVQFLETRRQRAHEAFRQAHVDAHRPVFERGRAIRLEAARMADAAAKLHKEAELHKQLGNRWLAAAERGGCTRPRTMDGNRLDAPVGSEAGEIALWAEHGL